MKFFMFLFYLYQLSSIKFEDLTSKMLDNNYKEDNVEIVLKHYRLYVAAVTAGYRLLPSKDIVDLYRDYHCIIDKEIKFNFMSTSDEMIYKYNNYRYADIKFFNSLARKTSKFLKVFKLNITTSKGVKIKSSNDNFQLNYEEDVRICFNT